MAVIGTATLTGRDRDRNVDWPCMAGLYMWCMAGLYRVGWYREVYRVVP